MNAEQAAALIPESARKTVSKLEDTVEKFLHAAEACGKSVDVVVQNGGVVTIKKAVEDSHRSILNGQDKWFTNKG